MAIFAVPPLHSSPPLTTKTSQKEEIFHKIEKERKIHYENMRKPGLFKKSRLFFLLPEKEMLMEFQTILAMCLVLVPVFIRSCKTKNQYV